jgi:hypothetical protein
MLFTRFRLFCAPLLAALLSFTPLTPACARRAIPDSDLSIPVLLTFKNGSSGSGFYLLAHGDVYLVTAKHVLFDPTTKKLNEEPVEALSYPLDLKETRRNLISLDISALNNAGNIKPHASQDVVVIKIGRLWPSSTAPDAPPATPSAAATSQPTKAEPLPPQAIPKTQQFAFLPGITIKETSASGIVWADAPVLKKFDDVLVGNEVIMLGYPTSLALVPPQKIDFRRPLLRKGIVAGTDPIQRSIILDCPTYHGDSGAAIFEVEEESFFQKNFRIIGVMSELVPFVDTWENQRFHNVNANLLNSGYSVITPIDFVLELVD